MWSLKILVYRLFFFLDLGDENGCNFRHLKYYIFRFRRSKILVWHLFLFFFFIFYFLRFRQRKIVFCRLILFMFTIWRQSNMCLQFDDEKSVFVAQRYHCNFCVQFDYIWRKYMQLLTTCD